MTYLDSVISKSKKSGLSGSNYLEAQSESNDSLIEDDPFGNLDAPIGMNPSHNYEDQNQDNEEQFQIDQQDQGALFGENFNLDSLESSNKDENQPSLFDKFL